MLALCRSGGRRLQAGAAGLLVLFAIVLVLQLRLDRSLLTATGVGWAPPFRQAAVDARWGQPPPRAASQRPPVVVTVAEDVRPQSPEPAASRPAGTTTGRPPPATTEPSEEAALRTVCARMRRSGAGLTPDVRQVVRWVCAQIGAQVPQQLDADGCNKAVVYNSIGRLGNLMGLYSIIYSYQRMFGATGYVESRMWNTLQRYFPNISLRPTTDVPDAKWKNILYQEAEEQLTCRPGDKKQEKEFFRIANYPDRNGIDVFHPFYTELRKEFEFAPRLKKQAQDFLRYARGNRSSVTYIGFHIRRTDYNNYIQKQYNSSLPDQTYFNKTMEYYRARFPDALFIVCSDDLGHIEKELRSPRNDVVMAGNRDIGDPGRDMALLSACNHSIVTVGTYGFWGAYLAGGTVLVPEVQTHLSRGDRHAPLLEIQLAGATNWIAMR